MDPATWLLLSQATQTVLNFPFVRKQQKQTLQKLHTNRLIAELNGVSTANQINDIADETLANNITVASSSGYSPLDSGSFEAIQERVNTSRDKDLSMNKISTEMALTDINNSLSNLKDQMLMSEINLVTDLGSIYYSHKNYTKNKSIEEAYRAKQIKELETQTELLRGIKKKTTFGYKNLMNRVTGVYASNKLRYGSVGRY